ncbi:FAD binding domain-containing protein [Vibrio lentus]|nr:FAD binding domain-containing protein [Vibrio lentus]
MNCCIRCFTAVRNQGTIGGNVMLHLSVTPLPLLIALNAKIKLRCGDESRTMPIEDYFISYKVTAQKESEFIEQIIIPKPS